MTHIYSDMNFDARYSSYDSSTMLSNAGAFPLRGQCHEILRRQFLHLATAAAVLPTATSVGSAQTFPTRPVTIVVPYPAGGPADAIARIVGEGMRISLGQPVIVENVSGAGGTLGVARVARAAPDGYTLSIGQLNSHVFSGAVYSAPYDLLRDLAPVALLTTNPLMIVGKRDLPASNLRELIGWLKANPDKASFATPGVGSPSHVWGAYFQAKTGTHFQFVPYRGGAPALQAVVSGQIDLTCLQASDLLPQVRSGNIKAYAILADTHWGRLPTSQLSMTREYRTVHAVLAWPLGARTHTHGNRQQA